MAGEVFSDLIHDLGKLFNSELKADEKNTCLFTLENGIKIQMEPDGEEEALMIGADLGPIPPGAYRREIMAHALQANGRPEPRYGKFAYSTQTETLLLFDSLALKEVTAEEVFEFLSYFAKKAETWKGIIERGETPAGTTSEGPGGSGRAFGLTP
ncbi:MAG: Tir chaperone family protein [Waddliaceae bacterium]|nr:Tir chaperone family protein [Waddliaceae bacterium]